jgi:hypothetical protein
MQRLQQSARQYSFDCHEQWGTDILQIGFEGGYSLRRMTDLNVTGMVLTCGTAPCKLTCDKVLLVIELRIS